MCAGSKPVWTLAMATAGLPLALRAARLDERSLQGIRLASFQPAMSGGGTAVLAAAGVTRARRQGRSLLPWLAPAALLGASLAATRVPRTCSATGAGGGPALSLVTLNIERDSADAPEIARRLLALDADVVVVLEYTPATAAACQAAGLHAGYRWVVEHLDEGWFGSAVFSRHEVAGWRVAQLGRRSMVVADLDVAGTRTTVVPVHTQAPIFRRDVTPWRTSFTELGDLVGTLDGPAVLAGDWNAGLGHAPFSRLLRRHGLVDAHRAAGRPWARTWPTDRWFPPVLCLDHVVVTPDVAVASIAEHPMPGTDHHALAVELHLPPG